MLSLRSFHHFIVLVEEGTFTRAAERLHLTQSALSRSIQSLEEKLGLRLLDRNPNGLQLTQAGHMAHESIERILADTDALMRAARLLSGHDTGKVRFGAGVYPAAAFLAPLMKTLATEYPGISAHVEIESWKRLLDKLDQNKLDFVVAITHSLPPSSDYTERALPPQRVGLFVQKDHPLLGIKRSQLRARLTDYGLATTDLPPRARQHLALAYGLTDPAELPVTLECDSMNTLREVALSSHTVLFSTQEAIHADVAAGRLVQLPLKYTPEPRVTCSIIHHTYRTLTPAAETLIGLIQELMLLPDIQPTSHHS